MDGEGRNVGVGWHLKIHAGEKIYDGKVFEAQYFSGDEMLGWFACWKLEEG